MWVNSISGQPQPARNARRPIRPKPLIPMRSAIVTFLHFSACPACLCDLFGSSRDLSKGFEIGLENRLFLHAILKAFEVKLQLLAPLLRQFVNPPILILSDLHHAMLFEIVE